MHNAGPYDGGDYSNLRTAVQNSTDAVDDIQVHHLNQHAIYGKPSVISGNRGRPIPHGEGATVAVRGNAAAAGTEHNLLHVEVERFLDLGAASQRLTGKAPTNGQYGEMVFGSLKKLGLSPKAAYKLSESARRQRIRAGHFDADPIPRYSNPVPGVKRGTY